MDWLGTVHLAAALLSLAAGLLVALDRKGTPRHRVLGRVYVAAMAVVNVTALSIYDLFGGFGPFHVAAILSGLTIIAGMVPARRRRPKRVWIARHAYWMAGSYVGLVAAAASETATRYLQLPMGPTVGVATLVVCVAGAWFIERRVPPILGRFGL